MSKIDEIIRVKNEDNLLENEEPLNYDEKQRILQLTMDRIPQNNNSKNNGSKYSKKKLLVGILVATMMIGTVAMANEYFVLNLDNKLLNYLGIDKNNKSLIGADSYINKYIEDENIKMNIKQTLGDKHNIYILLDVEIFNNDLVQKEIKSGKELTFKNVDINLDKKASSGWYTSLLEDKNPNDNKLSYIISYSTEEKINGRKIILNFEDIGYYLEDGEFASIVNGSWKTSWKLDYKDISKEIIVNRFIKINDNKYFITTINTSPITVSVNLIGKNSDNIDIKKVTLQDGTSYGEKDFISGSTSSSFLKNFTNIEFGKEVNPKRIKSITIGDKTIELEN